MPPHAASRGRFPHAALPAVPCTLAMALVLSILSILSALPAWGETVMTGDLPRQADLGFRVEAADGGLRIGEVEPDGPAAEAGLQEGDVLLAVGGRGFEKDYVGRDLLRRLDGDRPATLTVRRGGAEQDVTFTPPPRPLEELDGVDVTYGVVEPPDGARLRTVVTRPEGADGRLPAIFFTQWVSCDSVEVNLPGAWREVMRGVAERSGAVMMRVERSAGGDSEGPGCHELDFDTEVAHYRHAFETLLRSDGVDPDRVVIWGNSLGGLTAPLVAQGHALAGAIAGGAGALTYFERMLQFDRIGFERGDLDPRELHERMVLHARFHHEYLLEGGTPEEIVEEHPDLADVWENMRGTGDGVHYGRPYAWHHQAARKDFLEAWVDLDAPVLALFTGHDQFEYPHGHRLIVDVLNRLRPGSARYVEIPQSGHSYYVYPSAVDAAHWRNRNPAPELGIGPILDWLREVVGIEPAG